MFKILGLIMLFVMCCLLGIIKSLKFTRSEQELKDIILMLDKLKTQIEYSHDTVKEIMQSLSEDFPKLSFLKDTYNLMCDKYSFKTAWTRAIKERGLSLKRDDIQLVCKLGDIIGAYDAQTQIKEIKVTEKFLNASLNAYTQETKEKSRLYQSLGVLGGLMLVMIIV